MPSEPKIVITVAGQPVGFVQKKSGSQITLKPACGAAVQFVRSETRVNITVSGGGTLTSLKLFVGGKSRSLTDSESVDIKGELSKMVLLSSDDAAVTIDIENGKVIDTSAHGCCGCPGQCSS